MRRWRRWGIWASIITPMPARSPCCSRTSRASKCFTTRAWKLIEPRTDALVINIGDIVQVWSNDPLSRRRFIARWCVPMSSGSRRRSFSIRPTARTTRRCRSVIDAGHPARYRAINWGEFRSRRTAGDYANAGEYAQISQYYFSPNHPLDRGRHGVSSTSSRAPPSATKCVRCTARQEAHWGFVPNYAKVFCHRPEIMGLWAAAAGRHQAAHDEAALRAHHVCFGDRPAQARLCARWRMGGR